MDRASAAVPRRGSAASFTHRGDSLWWFCEIYLHRMHVITRAHRAIAALEQVAAAQPDAEWRVDGRDHVVGHLAHLVAARFEIHRLDASGPAV